MTALTVVHVETGRQLYGGALQVLYLIRGLKARGVRNILVCARDAAIADAASADADRVYAPPMHGDLDLVFLWRLRRILRDERPDIVHLHSRRGADVLGALAARLAKVPVVLTRRVDNPEPRWLVSLKYRLYDRVITISRGIGEVLRAEGIPERKLVCVLSAVDTERFRPGCERAWFEKEFGIEARERTVGMLAQFIERKGHRYLLDAIPAILRELPAVKFLLFGQGPLLEEIRSRIRAQALESRVRTPGFRTDLERILPCLDIVAHPAEMEGLGVALLQAAACAVPIVATPAGGIPEIVREGVNGYLVNHGNTAGLAERLLRLLRDSTLASRLGRAGRRIVEQEFSLATMVEGNLAVYRDLHRR